MSKSFVYFGYGSNLLQSRIHINSPTAVRIGVGKLEGFRLDFNRYSNRWKGASATIVPHKGFHVWGALWEIDLENLPNLDRQEGVHDNVYFPMEVEVILLDDTVRTCRVYQQCEMPTEYRKLKELPDERQPSYVYLKTILDGADESGIPEDYLRVLRKIAHNGFDGDVNLNINLHID